MRTTSMHEDVVVVQYFNLYRRIKYNIFTIFSHCYKVVYPHVNSFVVSVGWFRPFFPLHLYAYCANEKENNFAAHIVLLVSISID